MLIRGSTSLRTRFQQNNLITAPDRTPGAAAGLGDPQGTPDRAPKIITFRAA
jgi:hypothetical protein